MSSISVVILNWNGLKFLQQFFQSVVEHSPHAEIVVVDNNSTDGSIVFLNTTYPNIRVIKNCTNLGFCGGYNVGLKQIKSDYYVLLNNDVEVTENWLFPIIEMEKNSKIAISQPKILDFYHRNKFEYAGAAGGFLDNLGYPYCRGRIFDTIEIDYGQHDKHTKIAWATGACMFIKSDFFWKIGGFDEDFFAHMEEIDVCWQAHHLGFEVWSFPQSVVFHLGGGTLHKSNSQKTFLNFRNSLYLLHKNLPQRYYFVLIFLRLCLDALAGFKFMLNAEFQNVIAIIKAHFAYYLKLKKMNMKRKKYQKKVSILSTKSIILEYYILGKSNNYYFISSFFSLISKSESIFM